MKHFLRRVLTGVVGLTFLCAAAVPAKAGSLVLVAGPDQGTFTNNFGFGANGVGTTLNPNARYWSGSPETYTSHLNNAPVSILFVFGPNGVISTYSDSTAGTYDDVEDTQIGVLNLSGGTLTSFKMTATSGAPFGFDGDGIGDPNGANSGNTATGAAAPTNSKDSSDGAYGGPLTYFTLTAPGTTGNISSTSSLSAFANFAGGLPSGSSTYFSLEGNPGDLSNLGGGGGIITPAPEPSSIIMAAISTLISAGYLWRRRRSGLQA